MNKESYHIVGTTHIKNYGYIEFNPCEGRLRLIMNFSPNSNRIRGKVKRLFDAVDNLIEWINNNTSKIQGVVYNHDGVKYENQSYDTISKKEIIETLSQKQEKVKVRK